MNNIRRCLKYPARNDILAANQAFGRLHLKIHAKSIAKKPYQNANTE